MTRKPRADWIGGGRVTMTAKSDALETLSVAIKMVDVTKEMTGLPVAQLRATLEYAVACVEKICETKRPRRKETTL